MCRICSYFLIRVFSKEELYNFDQVISFPFIDDTFVQMEEICLALNLKDFLVGFYLS